MKNQISLKESRLAAIRDKDLLQDLDQILQNEKMFLQKELDTIQLATRLKVPGYRIPRVIKKHLGISVPEYISRLRIAYLHQQILEDAQWRKMTIDEMAFCAGFGSRNAFYTAYRKIHQTTPTAYIEAILGQHFQ